MRYGFLIGALIFCFRIVEGQELNLIDNHSFEEFYDDYGTPKPIGWVLTNSVDYFTSIEYYDAGKSFTTVPHNYAGCQNAQDGVAYVGLAYLYPEFGFREFLTNELLVPLEKNEKYVVEFYISLSDSSKYNSNSISFWFSKDIDNQIFHERDILDSDNFIVLNNLGFDKENWVKVEYTYLAVGGEIFFNIGNCLSCMTRSRYKDIILNRKEGQRSQFDNKYSVYYYLDNISIVKVPK